MTELNNRDYYLRRAGRSRELAESATNPAVARIHFEMAEHYEQLANVLSAGAYDKGLQTKME